MTSDTNPASSDERTPGGESEPAAARPPVIDPPQEGDAEPTAEPETDAGEPAATTAPEPDDRADPGEPPAEADAAADDAPPEPAGFALLAGEPEVSAAEREYQAAMRAAKSLGLDAEGGGVMSQADRLVARLGLDQPLAREPEPSTSIFDEPEEEPEPEEPEEDDLLGPEPTDNRAWYVLNTYSGHENRVRENLIRRIESMDVADRIFQVVVPTEEELEIRGGQRRQVQRKLLPGYVLVEMIVDENTWYVVRKTPGVTGFVGGDTPSPLPRDEVRSILKQMRVVEPRVRVGFEVGDNVRVMEGPFQDFIGEVDEINLEKGKVRVLISMFGRDTPVELDFIQVEKG